MAYVIEQMSCLEVLTKITGIYRKENQSRFKYIFLLLIDTIKSLIIHLREWLVSYANNNQSSVSLILTGMLSNSSHLLIKLILISINPISSALSRIWHKVNILSKIKLVNSEFFF